MKKILLVSLCSALSLSALSTGYTLNNKTTREPAADHAVIVSQPDLAVPEDSYAPLGLALIEKMDRLAESDYYISALSSSPELNTVITSISEADYSTPKAIYRSALPKGSVSKAFSNTPSSELSPEIKEILEHKLIAAIPNQINASNGASELAAASLVSLSESFLDDSITEPEIYVYLYNNDYSTIITLIPGTAGAVSASCGFVKTDHFKDLSQASEMTSYFKESLSIEGLDFKGVSL